jgi:putative nucleotide binding protein
MSDRRYSDKKKYYNNNRPSNRNNRNYKSQQYKKPKEFSLPTGTVIYILDVLERGHVRDGRTGQFPLVQAIEAPDFNLFELSYKRGAEIKLQDKIILGPDAVVGKVRKRLTYHKLTQTSKDLLASTIELHVADSEQLYVNFLNTAGPITTKRHKLSLLPGVGQKLLWEIIDQRNKVPFKSYADFDERIKSIHDVKSLISKRILNELIDDESKHYLFVKQHKPKPKQENGYNRQQGNRTYNRQPYQKRF